MDTDNQAPGVAAAPYRVLIADDDPRVRAALRALIEAETDVEVVDEAGTTAEVLDQAARLAPNAIILDLLLPRAVDGLTVLRRLAHQQTRPIIAISARGGLRHEALEAGATIFLEKGCATSLLIDALHQALRPTPSH